MCKLSREMKKPKQIGMGLDLRGSQSELRWEDKH